MLTSVRGVKGMFRTVWVKIARLQKARMAVMSVCKLRIAATEFALLSGLPFLAYLPVYMIMM